MIPKVLCYLLACATRLLWIRYNARSVVLGCTHAFIEGDEGMVMTLTKWRAVQAS
jgi:hypothetical protein